MKTFRQELPCGTKGVLAWMEELQEMKRKGGRLGTARTYLRTMKSLSCFLDGKDIPLGEVDDKLVTGYEQWLRQRRVTRNSISFYMRVLRSIYNKGIAAGYASQTNPFRNVYTGVDRTGKRAVSEDVLVRLNHLDLRESPHLALARDVFMFSYAMRGMAFVDVAYLRKSDVQGDEIVYSRKKTGQRMRVKAEPFIMEIICRYRDGDGPYIFPLIRSEDAEEARRQYESALNYHNRKLKLLARKLGDSVSLSSYTARHSWATAARRHGVPLSVISAGMGHDSERTTLIYLDSIENDAVDKANRELLEVLR